MTELHTVTEGEAGANIAPASVTFKGETFAVNDDISDWAVYEFAEAVDAGLDSNSYAGMAALIRFVVECIAPADRDRFRAVARRTRASSDDLFALLRGEIEADAERPTQPSADSSDGQTTTEPKSDASSDGKVFPITGRPDLQVAIERARRSA